MILPLNANPDRIFNKTNAIGFITGTEPSDYSYFLFANSRRGGMPDWQTSRTRIADRVPGSNRTLRQDMGAEPMRLEAELLFRDDAAFMRFMANRTKVGTLRMNRRYTVWPADREVQINGHVYAEFDNVYVVSDPSGIRTDFRRATICRVVFEREEP